MAMTSTYKVHLLRVDPKAGPNSTLNIEVKAQNGEMAKLNAMSQFHGYRATGASKII